MPIVKSPETSPAARESSLDLVRALRTAPGLVAEKILFPCFLPKKYGIRLADLEIFQVNLAGWENSPDFLG